MAAECGKKFGWKLQDLDNLFLASILHDCGVSKTIIHSRLKQFEWESEYEHCRAGATILKNCTPLSKYADIVLHHHTHWCDLKSLDLPETVKLFANCIYLADRVDILSLASLTDQSNILLGVDEILKKIGDKKGDWFCPELVDAFMKVSRTEAFWLRLEGDYVNGYASEWILHEKKKYIEFDQLRQLVHLFSLIIDAKSAFTSHHSDRVAKLARLLGELLNLPAKKCEMLELAGLLHDLGKLRVPDELLDKAGILTSDEYVIIKRHSFDTFNILNNIKGLKTITQWAAQHHERIDGSGYPFHFYLENISLESRIIAVADIFQALAQKRPYRNGFSLKEVLQILNEQVAIGKIDGNIVKLVAQNMDVCWQAAIGE
jgi:HD-GYP domain-containing protein (c-di-GMP phosphodiesterase class II)